MTTESREKSASLPSIPMDVYKRLAGTLVLAVLIFRLFYIFLANLPLSPEEAYYWSYSQHPALSYFDHPPMVAWIIFLFTGLLGSSEFAIRIGAIFLSASFSIVIYLLGSRFFDARAGFYAVLIANLIFVFNLYSTGITPDTPLLFFWALSIYLFARACLDEDKKYWLLLGVSMGCAYLSKYTAVLIPVSCLIFLLWSRSFRVRWKMFSLSVLISALLFLPVLIWNFQNNFASFLFQSADRVNSAPAPFLEKFLGLFAFQAVFVTPFIFLGMIFILICVIFSKDLDISRRFLLSASLPTIIFFMGATSFTWIKTNWPAPGYIAASVLMGGWLSRNLDGLTGKWKRIARAYIGISIVVALFLNGLAYFQPIFPRLAPPLSRANIMAGWRDLGREAASIREKMPRPGNTFVIGNGYQIASELSFYGFRGETVFSENAFHRPALAYDYWNQPLDSLNGKDAVVVADGGFVTFDENLLGKFFKSYREEPSYQVVIGGVPVRKFRIFSCYGYKGPYSP